MSITTHKNTNNSEILTTNPYAPKLIRQNKNIILRELKRDEYKIKVIKSYLNLPSRMQRLNPIKQYRKQFEDQYRKRLIQISQIQGKKLLLAIKQPTVYQYMQDVYKLQDEIDEEDYIDEDGPYYETTKPTKSEVTKKATKTAAMMMLPLYTLFTMMRMEQQEVLYKLGEHTFLETLHHTLTNSSAELSTPEIATIVKSAPDDMINFLLNSHSYPACENTIGTYQDAMTSILKTGFEKEWTQEEISNALSQYVGMNGEHFPQYIYDRIARNEVTRFGNEAKIYGWNKAGVERYDWIQGPGPCNEEQICLQRAEGGPYKVGNGPVPIDDSHISCLCELEEHIEKT